MSYIPRSTKTSVSSVGTRRKSLRSTFGVFTMLALVSTTIACVADEEAALIIPDVVGEAGNTARDTLEESGLEVELVAGDGAVWSPGNWEVASTDPAPGEEFEVEDEIIVHLVRPEDQESVDDDSSDAQFIEVPDVVGLKGDEASNILEQAGLEADFISEDGTVMMPSNWEVESTEPIAGDEASTESEVSVHVVRPESSEEPEESDEEEASEEEAVDDVPEPQDDDIAERLEAEALVQFMVDDFIDLLNQEYYDFSLPPYYAITGFESIGRSTVRVNVQEPMTDDEEEQMARWFFNMTCQEVPELDTLVVRDTSGVDSNFYASRYPDMPYC